MAQGIGSANPANAEAFKIAFGNVAENVNQGKRLGLDDKGEVVLNAQSFNWPHPNYQMPMTMVPKTVGFMNVDMNGKMLSDGVAKNFMKDQAMRDAQNLGKYSALEMMAGMGPGKMGLLNAMKFWGK